MSNHTNNTQMKKFSLLLALAITTFAPVSAQKTVVAKDNHSVKKQIERDSVLDVCDQMPQFNGGDVALMDFIRTSISYPKDAAEQGLQGRVVLRFIIEKDGTISNSEVLKSASLSLDTEALRVVNSMPQWIPGKHKGKVVRVRYVLPVTFRLQ
ncbi:MAG: energy transducer TonB [Bacteroidales bacterium]|nr:energy transducer TonB [Bacteroidales bacterium]